MNTIPSTHQKDILAIAFACKEITLDFWLDYGLLPREINQNHFVSCVIHKTGLSDNVIGDITLNDVLNTGEGSWQGFNVSALQCLNMSPTHGLDYPQIAEALQSYANLSHRWIIYENKGTFRHFDAECPEGVENPLQLPAFDRCIQAYKKQLSGDELTAFNTALCAIADKQFKQAHHLK